jgi:hypothetical protein
MNSRF